MDRREFLRKLAYGSGAAVGGLAVSHRVLGTEGPYVSTGSRAVVPVSGQVNGLVVQPGETVEIVGTLETTANVVVYGTLKMRPGSTLRFVGVDESAFVGGGLEVIGSDVGLWVMGNGRLDIRGTAKRGWLRLAPGSQPPASWQNGDEILVCPNGPGQWDPGDFRIATFPNVNPPAPFALPDGALLPTECANLTRDVVIEGTPSGRSHITIRSSQPQTVKHCLIRYMGPRKGSGGVLGRYPLHFHKVQAGSRGSIVDGVVVRESGNRAFVPHSSHGVTMRDCVAYDVTDAPYWWDVPDITHDTLWTRCLAALVRTEDQGFRLSGFNLGAGIGNTVRGSAAVGVQGQKDAAGFEWPDGLGQGAIGQVLPRVWTFADNVSHNNANHGSFVWQNNGDTHLVDRFVIYRCGGAGFDHGAYQNRYQYRDFQIAECATGINWHALGIEASPSRGDGYSLAFEGGLIKDCGIGVDVGEHSVPSTQPALFKDIVFANVDTKVVVDDSRINSQATFGDFVNCNVEPSDVEFVAARPGSLLRFQRTDVTAWELDDDGNVRDRPAFYPAGMSFFVGD